MSRRGFTLIELVVVVVILAIVAGVVAPRLVGGVPRELRAAGVSAADLLSTAARREALTSQRVALDYDGQALRMLTLRSAGLDDDNPRWLADPLAGEVALGEVSLASAWANGRALDPRAWRVTFEPGERRPALALVLEAPGGRARCTVVLGQGESDAAVVMGDAAVYTDGSVDLHAAGRGIEPW